MVSVEAGFGFWYEPETGYLVQFSEDKEAWQAGDDLLIIPPVDHPWHEAILRHEAQHAKHGNWLSKHYWALVFWLFFCQAPFFGGFDELLTAYRSKSMHLTYREFANIFELGLSFFWLGYLIWNTFILDFYAICVFLSLVLILYFMMFGARGVKALAKA